MKKVYIKPEIQVINLKNKGILLLASGDAKIFRGKKYGEDDGGGDYQDL